VHFFEFLKLSFREHRRFFLFFLIVAFAIRLYCVAVFPHVGGDSPVYEKLASNMISARTLSLSDAAPFVPCDIRTPGYPLFIAFSFKLFGYHDTPIRLLQVLLDVITCILIGIIAFGVAPEEHRVRISSIAFAAGAVCPFLAEYTASILSESLTIFLTTLAVALAVYALNNGKRFMWLGCGIVCGMAVMVRPDSLLLIAAIGLTLLFAYIKKRSFREMFIAGGLLGFAVVLVLAPWIIRNWVSLKKFQPLSARHAEMPGEYVPKGYMRWVRTWIDSSRYEDLALFSLDEKEIDLGALPDKAFDSQEEKEKIGEILDAYNDDTTMTPEIDQRFGQVADERIARSPFRYYVVVPAKRAFTLWVDTHSELLPMTSLIYPVKQQAKDGPIDFTVSLAHGLLNALYLIMGLVGVFIMRKNRVLLLFFILAIGIRTVFLSSLENTESRYVLEVYPFVEVFAAIGVFFLWERIRTNPKSVMGERSA
jgi:4-amino-4-deoxy-L-arabinose transferase-like glycosyltransferase